MGWVDRNDVVGEFINWVKLNSHVQNRINLVQYNYVKIKHIREIGNYMNVNPLETDEKIKSFLNFFLIIPYIYDANPSKFK